MQSSDVNFFKSILGNERVLTDDNDVTPFNIDWIKNCRGQLRICEVKVVEVVTVG